MNSYISDDDFLDEKKLVGQVYRLSLSLAITQKKTDRHRIVMEIVSGVMESLTPACNFCGKSVPIVVCKNCDQKNKGILSIHH
jgi:hypothetical protein